MKQAHLNLQTLTRQRHDYSSDLPWSAFENPQSASSWQVGDFRGLSLYLSMQCVQSLNVS